MILQVLKNWAWLQRTQWIERERLKEIQCQKIVETVDTASRMVPFYRRLYLAPNMTPDTLAVRDFAKLPIVTRELLRSTPLEQRTRTDVDRSSCEATTTSGSTGSPVTALEDPSWAAYQEALQLRHLWAYGARPMDRICRATRVWQMRHLADNAGMWGFLRRKFNRQLSLAGDLESHMEFFSTWKPTVMTAHPSYLRTLIRLLEETGRSLDFKLIVTVGEVLDESTRSLIEKNLNAEVFDQYGTEELGSVAWECPTHAGYHVNDDSLVMEILTNGEPAAPGESGEVCVSNLCDRATPMIRYLPGDIATPLNDECACGRGLSMLKRIEGRIVDSILTKEGKIVSPYIVTSCLEDIPDILQFRVVQQRDHSIDITVKLDSKSTDSILPHILQTCKELFGETPVNVRSVDKIEMPTGSKFRLVESRLANW